MLLLHRVLRAVVCVDSGHLIATGSDPAQMRVGASDTHAPCPSDILMLLIIKVHSLVSGLPHVFSTSQVVPWCRRPVRIGLDFRMLRLMK